MPDQRFIALKKRYLAVNFLGMVMIGAVFLYALAVEVVKRVWAPFAGLANLPKSTADLLTYIFLFLAVGLYILMRLISKKLVARSPEHLPQAAIITFALCEVVAVFGLVLFLLTGNALDFYLFFAISLFLFYIFYPKYNVWEEIVSTAAGPSPRKRRTKGNPVKAA